MRPAVVDFLACPLCHAPLATHGADKEKEIRTGTLTCSGCSREYPILKGIPHFIEIANLTGINRRFSRLYDWFSWIYAAFSRIAFAAIGMTEEQGRREITDRIDPHGGRVLEVSVGSGGNLPYLLNRPDVGEVFGLDISPGQLNRCQNFVTKKGWNVELFLGNGEQLPFANETFEGVFHVGGINFFNDKKAAIEEMIRVARPGTRILIADETEKGARGYEKTLPGFKSSFEGNREIIKAPIHLVPEGMLEKQVSDIWKGWFYCLEFKKP